MSKIRSMTADLRENTGKGFARRLRDAGKIPSVVYGAGKPDLKVAVDAKSVNIDFNRPGFWSSLIDLKVGNDIYRVIPTEVQTHPVTDLLEHIDFMHVVDTSRLTIHAKLSFINQDKCAGIKLGGVLNVVNRTIDLICTPDNIVSNIDVDVLDLKIGDSIHLSDLNLPASAQAVLPGKTTIATITGSTTEEIAEDTASDSEEPVS